MKDLQIKFAEMENIWLFFQRFADEQGNDKIKICRALYPTVLQKLNAMEWLDRYIYINRVFDSKVNFCG